MGFKDIKYDFPVYQMENTQIHKYANTQNLSAWKTQHVLYFWKAWDSKISNMTFPCIICKIHKYMNTQICNYTNTKCSKDPICALFLKSTGFMDIKYNIPVYQMWNTQIYKYTNKKCFKDPTYAIFLKIIGFKDIKYDIPMYQI